MSLSAMPIAKLRLGSIVSTPGVLESLTQEDLLEGIQRHQAGDWGNVSQRDSTANDRALTVGTRILSSYLARNGTRFWIITEADRSATTVLLPEEY